MNKQSKSRSILGLCAVLFVFPLISHADESPGALTIVVKDQVTERPIPSALITLKERETASTQTLETNEQGRIIVDELNPGLYSVNVSKAGFASLFEPSIRVITRKNVRLDYELRAESIEVVEVRAQQSDLSSSASNV
ncbi:MAG: carboxypeptidase-like regulatory domain-containing protein, partial [Pseudomonadota bacterium]|nr:carboxypeptidase-like regulatory domain-containing protein [Pseudomonadota bacterium]